MEHDATLERNVPIHHITPTNPENTRERRQHKMTNTVWSRLREEPRPEAFTETGRGRKKQVLKGSRYTQAGAEFLRETVKLCASGNVANAPGLRTQKTFQW